MDSDMLMLSLTLPRADDERRAHRLAVDTQGTWRGIIAGQSSRRGAHRLALRANASLVCDHAPS